MPRYNSTSLRRQADLIPELIEVTNDVILIRDNSIIETSRDEATQTSYFQSVKLRRYNQYTIQFQLVLEYLIAMQYLL